MTRIKIDTKKVICIWYCPKCREKHETKIDTYGGGGWGTRCRNQCVDRYDYYRTLEYSHTELEIDKELADFIYETIGEKQCG